MCFALSHPCGLKVTAACFFPWHPQQFPDDVNHHATSPVFSVILSLLSVVVPFWFQRLQNCQAESRRIAASRRLEQCLPFILPLLLFSPLVLLRSSPLSRISLSPPVSVREPLSLRIVSPCLLFLFFIYFSVLLYRLPVFPLSLSIFLNSRLPAVSHFSAFHSQYTRRHWNEQQTIRFCSQTILYMCI